MAEDERTATCRNCGRNQPLSLLNKEGRCQTCGPSETVAGAPDPSEIGPHGEQGEESPQE